MEVENSNLDEVDEADSRRTSVFTSGDHWDHSIEKLRSWRTIQTAILAKLNTGEVDTEEDITVNHGFQLLKVMVHPETVRSFTYVKTMHGLVFITNSGTDMRSYMNIWNLQGFGAENVSRKKVSIVTKCTLLKYIPKLRKLVCYSPDQKLKVLDDVTRGFEVLCEVITPSSIFCLEWNPDTDELVCGGTQGLFIYTINEVFQLVESKTYLSKLSWCSSILLDTKNKLMMSICDQKIYVYNYVKGNCTHILQNRHNLALTCCTYYESQDMLLTASKDGTIKLWNGLSLTLVHELAAHTDAVTGMEIHRADSLLFSCSLDFTIKVWRLDTYELFMRVDVGDPVRGMKLMGVNELCVWSDKQIRNYRVNMIYGFYAPVYSAVHKLTKVSSFGNPSSIVCSSNDGVIRVYTSLSASTHTTLYPMKSFQILKEFAYVRSSARLLVVLDSGDVVVQDATTNPTTASHILEADMKHDEHIVSITVLKRDRALGEKESAQCDTLVFAGHKNGEISLLYSTKSRLLHVCRAHAGSVDILETSEGKIEPYGSRTDGVIGSADRLLSCSKDFKIKVWGLVFDENDEYVFSLVCLKLVDSSNMGVPVKLCMLGNTLAVAWPTKNKVSKLIMYCLNDEVSPNLAARRRSIIGAVSKGIVEQSHDTSFDHTKGINGLACHPYHNIFATTSADGFLKIWNRENVLIRELVFDNSLSCCCFADTKGTILIGYKGHINYVSIESYLPAEVLRNILLQDFEDEEDEIPIPYQSSMQEPDFQTLAREPAVNNPRRNARVLKDTDKSDEVPRKEETLEIEEVEPERSSTNSSTAWRKLGASNRMVNILNSVRKAARDSSSVDADAVKSSPQVKRRAIDTSGRYETLDRKSTGPRSKAQFEMQVKKKQKEKHEAVLEEKKRRLEVARQLENERKNRSNWVPIAPDGYIPNSVIRNLLGDLCSGSKSGTESQLAFFDIAMLIAKLPGLKGAEKSVNDYLVDKAIPDRKSAKKQVRSKQSATWQNAPEKTTVPSLIADDASQMLMQALKWCCDHMNAPIAEVSHFYMRKGEVIDLDPPPVTLPPVVKPVVVKKTEDPPDKKKQGIELLKRMSKEPWWNKSANLTVVDALQQIASLLPRAVGQLHSTLLSYLADIHGLFGIPDIMQSSLANGLVRNINNQKGNEAAVLATLGCIGNLELKMSKIITELDRLVKADSRKSVVDKAMELLKKFTEGKKDPTDTEQLQELSHPDAQATPSRTIATSLTTDWSNAGSDADVESDGSSSVSPLSGVLPTARSSGMVARAESLETRESIYSTSGAKNKSKFKLAKSGSNSRKLGIDSGRINQSYEDFQSPSKRVNSSASLGNELLFPDSSTRQLVNSLDSDEANDESDSSGHEMDFSKTVANQGPRAKRILRNHSGKIVEDDAEYDLTDNDYMRHKRSSTMRSALGRDSGLASTKSPRTRSSSAAVNLDSSADLDLATLSLNGRLTLSLDGADLTDSSDSVAPGLDMNYLVPLGSTNAEEMDWREVTKTLHSKSLKSLKNLSNTKSEKWLDENILPPIQLSTLPDNPSSGGLGSANRNKLSFEQRMVMEHVQNLETSSHDHKHVHGLSEVAVGDLIRNLWTKVDESDAEWKGKYKMDVNQPHLPFMTGKRQPHRVQPGDQFRWDAPLPPAPKNKLSISNWKDMHSQYCEYWRMARKRMHDYTTTTKEDHFQSLLSDSSTSDGVPGESPQVPLYPFYTKLLLQQLIDDRIDYTQWYPIFNYPPTYHLLDESVGSQG